MRSGRVGNYRILSCIGEGGMGAVYQVEHVMLGRPAAIKVLLPELSRNEEMVSRFFNEARATAQLQHPGIIDVYDFGTCEDDNAAFIVMELLQGQSLRQRLADRGRLSWQEAVYYTRQIASALAAAHRGRIVHRDLKPDNLFIVQDRETGQERIKVLDFGIAKLAAQTEVDGLVKTRAGMLMGTPSYMSPQQCRGAGEVDHRTDIYSVGCILFEMVCGRPPFLGEGVGDLLHAHMSQSPPAPSQLGVALPPELEATTMRLLAKSEHDRQQSMDELVAELDRLMASTSQAMPGPIVTLPYGNLGTGVSQVAPPSNTAPQLAAAPSHTTLAASTGQITAPPKPSRRWMWIGIGAVVASVAAVTIVLATADHEAEPVVPAAAVAPPPAEPPPPPEPAKRKPKKLKVTQLTDEELAAERARAKEQKPVVATAPAKTPGKPAEPDAKSAVDTLLAFGPVGEWVVAKLADSDTLVKVLGPTAELRVESTPTGAAITYDGAVIGKTPLSITVDRGAYDIVVDLALADYADRTVTISALVDKTARVQMPKLVAFRVLSLPPAAEVVNAGEVLGTTPLEIKLAPDEPQTFTFRLAGYLEKTVDLTPTKTALSATVALEHEPQQIVHEIDSIPPGAEVVVDNKVLGKTPFKVEFLEDKGKFRTYTLRVPGDQRYRDTTMRAPADKPLKRTVRLRDICANRADADSTTPSLVNPYDPCRNK